MSGTKKEDTKTEEIKPTGFTFKAGTRIAIGDHQVTLTKDSRIYFDGAGNESMVVGILTVSRQLEINREQLKKNYNGFGLEIVEESEETE